MCQSESGSLNPGNIGGQTGRQKGRKAGGQTGGKTDREAGRQLDRLTGREPDRQAGSQTDKETDKRRKRSLWWINFINWQFVSKLLFKAFNDSVCVCVLFMCAFACVCAGHLASSQQKHWCIVGMFCRLPHSPADFRRRWWCTTKNTGDRRGLRPGVWCHAGQTANQNASPPAGLLFRFARVSLWWWWPP